MITKNTVWNTKTDKYRKEHENSHKDKSRNFIINRIIKTRSRSLLELGVGSGILIDNLAENSINVSYTGIDASDAFLNIVKEKYPRVELIRHDFDDGFDLGMRKFDIVYARHVFEHVKHYEKLLRSMAKAAVKEVIVVFFRPLGDEKIQFREHKGTYYNSYNKEEVISLAKELFDHVDYFKVSGNLVGPSKNGKNWILHCRKN